MIYQGQEGREFSGSEIFYRNLERDSGKRKISRRYTGFDHFSESGIRQIFARDAILGYRMRASLEQERECGVIRTPLPDHDSSCLDCTTLNFHFNESSLTSLFLAGSGLQSFTSCTADSKDEWEIPRDVLIIGHKIGEGQFGLVLEGTLMTGKYGEEVRRQETLL